MPFDINLSSLSRMLSVSSLSRAFRPGAPHAVFACGAFSQLPAVAIRPFAQVLLRQNPPPTTFALHLTHFQSLFLFAAIISVAFGFFSRRRPLGRLKYALWSLLLFLFIGIAIGWVMYPFSR